MTLITLSSSVCAEAPGYIVVTTMDGGATDGYCEIGSCVVATPPITSMNSASTHAKTGRSMKNWAMKRGPLLAGGGGRRFRCRGGRGFTAVGCGRRCRLPRHGFHWRAGLQFLETIDHHLLAGFQSLEHDPLPILCRADLDRARRHFAVRTHHHHAVAAARACHCLLRQLNH